MLSALNVTKNLKQIAKPERINKTVAVENLPDFIANDFEGFIWKIDLKLKTGFPLQMVTEVPGAQKYDFDQFRIEFSFPPV